jgi:chemotaxis protein methyltransferase WspC
MNVHEHIRHWLLREYGLGLDSFGQGSLDGVLAERCRANATIGHEAYFEIWLNSAAERGYFLDSLLVGETWFFRERATFSMTLDWLAESGIDFSATSPLRILSLPCSSGEEAWSIAAILTDAGFDAGRVQIEAMDISPSALALARQGVYPVRKLRQEPPERWAHVLKPEGRAQLRVDDTLRAMVTYTLANAMDPDCLANRPPYHIIFCRNMLIYMANDARLRICQNLLSRLQPGGLLFLGHAETAPAGSGLRRYRGAGAFAWCQQASSSQDLTRTPSANRGDHAAVPTPRPSPKPSPETARQTAASVVTGGRSASPHRSEPQAEVLAQARSLADAAGYEKALTLLTDASELVLVPESHCLMGTLASALGRPQEAIAHFRHAIYLDPHHEESLAQLALLLERNGASAEASRLRSRLTEQQEARS